MKGRGRKHPELDILRQRRILDLEAEAALQKRVAELNARLAAIVESSGDAIIGKDMDGVITTWNKGAARIYGYSAEEATGQPLSMLVPAEHRDEMRGMMERTGRGEDIAPYETVHVRKDGGQIIVSQVISPVRDGFGTIIGASIIARDMTEIRRAEEQIKFAKEEWERTFDAMPDMVAVIDAHHVITRANAAMAARLGVRREDIIGRLCYNLLHGTESPPAYCLHEKAMSSGKECFEEIFEKNLNGHYVISATPLSGPNGSFRGIVHVWRDITRRKRLEQRLREAALTDPLTGLSNRRGFFSLAEQQLRIAERKKRSMMLLYLDVDRMKEINDTHGHMEGDHALCDTAALLKGTFRESDIIARMGGDEFAVFLTEPSGPDAGPVVIKHFLLALDRHNRAGGRPFQLSLSIGSAYYDPERPVSIVELLTKADTRMYEYKNGQRRLEVGRKLEKERRLHDRIIVDSSWWAEVEGLGRVAIKDISAQGICLETGRGLDVDERCGIMVHSPHDWDVPLKGVVIWSRPAGRKREKIEKGVLYEAGIRISEDRGGTIPLFGPAAEIVDTISSSRRPVRPPRRG